MTNTSLVILTTSVLIGSSVTAAQAQDRDLSATDALGKWRASFSAVASNAAIEIVESEVTLPDGLADEDFEVTLSDSLAISSTIVSGGVGYRILPFAEVSARVGLVSSDTKTGVIITGTPSGPFSEFFDGPITVDRDTSMDVNGYSLGLGANAIVPVARVGEDLLAAYSGFQYVWNELDDTVTSEGAVTSLGLVYPVNPNRAAIAYRVGAGYNWISRNVEQQLVLNGETVAVKVTQEFENPWTVEAGLGIPVSPKTLLSLGVFHHLSGETSALVSASYRFGAGA